MQDISDRQRSKVTLYSILLMALTSAHHLYGAMIYHTPWRMHVLFLSVPVIIATLVLNQMLNQPGSRRWVLWLYWIITLSASVLLIGIFEGIYNHILKNILFFSGFPAGSMAKLYPGGTYEMPDDFLFEFTGVTQGMVAIPLIMHFIKLTRNAFGKQRPTQL